VFAIPTVIVAFAPIDWKQIICGLTPKDVVLFLLSTLIQVCVVGRRKKGKEGRRCDQKRSNGMQWRIQDFEKGGSYYSVREERQKILLDHAHF